MLVLYSRRNILTPVLMFDESSPLTAIVTTVILHCYSSLGGKKDCKFLNECEKPMDPGTRFFLEGASPLKIYSAISHTKQRQRWRTSARVFIMDGRHPERPPRRAAQPISSADSGERSVAARRSWAAPGLSSGRFVVAAAAIYSV